jgi:hypothetical protein
MDTSSANQTVRVLPEVSRFLARRLVHRFAEVVEAHDEELAQLETINQGKSINIARAGRMTSRRLRRPSRRRCASRAARWSRTGSSRNGGDDGGPAACPEPGTGQDHPCLAAFTPPLLIGHPGRPRWRGSPPSGLRQQTAP